MRTMQERCQQDEKSRADTILYTTVMKAWGNSMEADKGDRAEALLREMYREHEKGALTKPNSVRTISVTLLDLPPRCVVDSVLPFL